MTTEAVPASAPDEGPWSRLLRRPGPAVPATVAAANLALALVVLFTALQDFPNSGDEYAYLVSAEIFSRGRTSVPSPPLPRFFDVMHVVNDGKFYGKYPPGWPLLLAVGVFFGVPWIVNPLLGVATVFAVHGLARRLFSVEAANASALSLLGSPFLVFNSASYFSHPACLLAVVMFLRFLFDVVERPESRARFAGLGACAGAAFLIRPFTAVVLLAAPTVHLLLSLARREGRKERLVGLSISALPFLVFLGIFFEYNRIQTGNPLLQPFEMYASWDVPKAPKDRAEWASRFSTHVLDRTWELNRWLALSPLFLALGLAIRATRKDPRVRVLALSFASLFAAFFFYWGEGGFQYGPRYLYEALGGLAVITGAVIASFGRRGALMLASILILGTTVFLRSVEEVSEQITSKKDIYRCAEERKLSNSIVFVRSNSGPAPAWDLPRNGIDFNPPVLFVRDLGPENRLLLQEYPGRDAYYYEYDGAARKGRLTPYAAEGSGR